MNVYQRGTGVAALLATLTVGAPAVASASKVSVTTDANGVQKVVFKPRAGEANQLFVQQGADPLGTFRDLGAPLAPGPGCTASPITCPFAYHEQLRVVLGDRDDYAAIDIQGPHIEVQAAAGNDRVWANTLNGAIELNGGAGDDALTSAGHYPSAVNGGAGNDSIFARSEGATTIVAGPGDDLVGTRDGVSEIEGGDGNDRIVGGVGFVADTPAAEYNGGPGDDVLAFASRVSARFTMRGGTGDDVIQTLGGGDDVSGGGGDDRIDVSDSGADTVSCGAGQDTVWTNGDDTIDRSCESVLTGSPGNALPEIAAAVSAAATAGAGVPVFPAP